LSRRVISSDADRLSIQFGLVKLADFMALRMVTALRTVTQRTQLVNSRTRPTV
jgi:hypothetical protein